MFNWVSRRAADVFVLLLLFLQENVLQAGTRLRERCRIHHVTNPVQLDILQTRLNGRTCSALKSMPMNTLKAFTDLRCRFANSSFSITFNVHCIGLWHCVVLQHLPRLNLLAILTAVSFGIRTSFTTNDSTCLILRKNFRNPKKKKRAVEYFGVLVKVRKDWMCTKIFNTQRKATYAKGH